MAKRDTTPPTLTITSNVSALKAGETAMITFTFSEAPVGFQNSDITVTGGTLSLLSGTGLIRTAIFTPLIDLAAGFANISVAAGSYTDAARNLGKAATMSPFPIDTLAPSVSISSDVTALKAGQTALITLTFSEDPGNSFSLADINASGGTVSNLSGTGLTRTVTFTPTANQAEGSATISINAGSFTDAAGNANKAASMTPIPFDTLAPTLTLSSNATSLKAGETAEITLSFSEAPTNFTAGDISVSNGTLSALMTTADPLIYTAIFTPNTDLANSTAEIHVVDGSYTDRAGNAGSGATLSSISLDTLSPTVTITSNVSTLKSGETALISFTFSEIPFNFDINSINISNGNLVDFSADSNPLIYTARFIPVTDLAAAEANITIVAGSYTDAAGNAGLASNVLPISLDTLAPTLTISSNVSSLLVDETAQISFSFSETPADFSLDDISVSNGSVSNLVATADPLVYTATFTPYTDIENVTADISVAAGSYHDSAGNTGSGASLPAISLDTRVPTLTISSDVSALKVGETALISFVFSEIPSSFSFDDILVNNGTLVDFVADVNPLIYTARFVPNTDIASGIAEISVASGSYTDSAGNAGIGASMSTISLDTLAPTVTITNQTPILKAGETALITFTFNEIPVDFSLADIYVTAGTLSNLTVTADPTIYTAIFTPPANHAASSSIILIDAGTIFDAAGNSMGDILSDTIIYDTLPPSLSISTDVTTLKAGETANITFSFSEKPHNFNLMDVTFNNGILLNLTASADAKTYYATFQPSVDLAAGTGSIAVAAGSYNDVWGNAGTGAQSANITIDTLRPYIVSATPAANSTGVATNSNIDLIFNENIYAGNGAIYVVSGSNTQVINIHDSSQVTLSGNQLSINPSYALYSGQTCNVYIAPDAILDAAGNSYEAISSAVSFTSQADLLNLSNFVSGPAGVAITGAIDSQHAGYSLSNAGDVNADGFDDVLVGSSSNSISGGNSYVIFGSSTMSAINLSNLPAGFSIFGQGTEKNGYSVSGVGDVNADGFADLLIGTPYYSHCYLVFGKANNEAVNLFNISQGIGGFIINGSSNDPLTYPSVSGAGDINSDGLADFIIGSPYGDRNGTDNAGLSYVVFGKTDTNAVDLTTLGMNNNGFVIRGYNPAGFSGISVSNAGDINGDGRADVIVGATGELNQSGRSFVVYGKSNGFPVDLANLGSAGFTINGDVVGDSGFSVSAAGDINGDGYADLLIGAPDFHGNSGAYIVFGKANNTDINLSNISLGSGGFFIDADDADERAGFSVSNAGDFNGDGLADIIIGATTKDADGLTDVGRSYLIYGKTDNNVVNLSAIANGVGGFALTGQNANDQSGFSVSAGGDINADGLADLLVSAPNYANYTGRSYIIFGSIDSRFGNSAVDQMGTTADDTLTGSSNNETLLGNLGNDTIIANGGYDVIYAGGGNDTLVLNASNLTALTQTINNGQLARINGGAGIDTLQLSGSAIQVNLTQINNLGAGGLDDLSRIESIEKIDLTGNGNNSLTLSIKDLYDMTGCNLINSGNQIAQGWSNGSYSFASSETRHQLIVTGNSGDQLSITDGDWNKVGSVNYNNSSYQVYNSTQAQLLVANEVAVSRNNVVVFDMIEGVSSSHSNRTFDSNTSYNIYVRVNSNSPLLSTDGIGPKPTSTWGLWQGANNLSNDDKIILVGSGSNIMGFKNHAVSKTIAANAAHRWESISGPAAIIEAKGTLVRAYNNAATIKDIWNGTAAADIQAAQLLVMPQGILTSQGLA